mmetsp:Transcript_24272/g.52374  ORF Transcript_24272/g.52374 Transcript_24272/m.52374 type:complete len:308 (-) Transcript_24272:543-1466(-)
MRWSIPHVALPRPCRGHGAAMHEEDTLRGRGSTPRPSLRYTDDTHPAVIAPGPPAERYTHTPLPHPRRQAARPLPLRASASLSTRVPAARRLAALATKPCGGRRSGGRASLARSKVERQPLALVLLGVDDRLIELVAVVVDRELDVVVDGHRQGAGALGLLARVEGSHVRVLERLLDVRSLLLIEEHELPYHVDRLVGGARHPCGLEVPLRALPGASDHGVGELGAGGFDVNGGRRACDLEDLLQLVDGAGPRHHRLAVEHLCNDAPDRPHVDGECVVVRPEYDLRSPVPPRRHIVGEHGRALVACS